ncbi:MAG: hypothetical protein ACOVP7_04220 [Lacibacter sp.]
MQKVMAFCLLLVLGTSASAQVYVQGGASVTSQANIGGDLSIGFVAQKTTLSVGYLALMDNDEPLMLNVQAGYRLNNAWRIYGGYVRKHFSSDVKLNNNHSWLGGVEYNSKRFMRGNFYYSANYIPQYFFVTVGMKFNYR